MKPFRAISVQMEWRPEYYSSEESFAGKLNSVMDKIEPLLSKELPNLVSLPEDLGTPLILATCQVDPGEYRTFASAASGVVRRNIIQVLTIRLMKGAGNVRALYLLKSHDMALIYLRTLKRFASRLGTYVVGGSILLPDFDNYRELNPMGNAVYNISFVFSPEGNIIGRQKKVHLIDLEGQKGLDAEPSHLSDISVIDLGFVKMGLAICYDAFFMEVVEKLVAQGAEVLVQPSANPAFWTRQQEEEWATGTLKMVRQFTQLKYGINPMMVGKMFDLPFEGRSSIIGKADSGPNDRGYLRRAKSKDQEEILVADLFPSQ